MRCPAPTPGSAMLQCLAGRRIWRLSCHCLIVLSILILAHAASKTTITTRSATTTTATTTQTTQNHKNNSNYIHNSKCRTTAQMRCPRCCFCLPPLPLSALVTSSHLSSSTSSSRPRAETCKYLRARLPDGRHRQPTERRDGHAAEVGQGLRAGAWRQNGCPKGL